MKTHWLHLLMFSLTLFMTQTLMAHGSDADTKLSGSSLDAFASMSFRSKGMVESNALWRLPGIMMGGEADPTLQGMTVDDVQLIGTWQNSDQSQVHASLLSHTDSGAIDLEHFWFEYFIKAKPITLALGKMDGRFSPSANWHASQSDFSEAPLMSDAFFGRHFNDQGLRSMLTHKHWQSGVELWNGNSWPASAGEGAADVFTHTQFRIANSKVKTGVWLLYSNAQSRPDTRYVGGHTHNSSVTPTVVDVRFDGHTASYGYFIDYSHKPGNNYELGFFLETIKQDLDGDISDPTRQAGLKGNYLGYVFIPRLTYGKSQWSIRHEMLSLKNELSGNSPEFIAADANLLNTGHQPERTTLSWLRKLNNHFRFRVELINDNALAEENNRLVLGILWKDALYKP